MGRAVLTDRDAGMGCADLHIQVRIADGVANLLKGTAGCKHGKCRCERHFPGCCDPGRDSHHVRLRDAAVNVALREGLLEGSGLGCACEVSIQDNDIVVFLS